MIVYVFAVGAALLFGLGSVIQQRVAFDAPPGKSLKLSLLLWLVQQPMWLAGVGTAVLGNVLSASALAVGSVALVQPLLVTRLLFAVPLSAAWARQRLHPRDWLGMLAVGGGLASFIALGQPQPEQRTGEALLPWLYTAVAIGVPIALLIFLARRLRPTLEAPLLGAGAGMLFGMQSGLMHTAVGRFTDQGLLALLLTPMTYGVAVTAVLGTLLAQSAYEMAPLTASYPTLAAVEPLAGIGIGIGVLGGTLAVGALPVAIEVAGLLVMTLGIYVLATSPLVAGSSDAMQRRQTEEAAARSEDQLERDLNSLQRDLTRVVERRPSREAQKTVAQLREQSAQVMNGLAQLATQNEQSFSDAGQDVPSGAVPGADHEQVMTEWRRERCEREDRLRTRANDLNMTIEQLRS